MPTDPTPREIALRLLGEWGLLLSVSPSSVTLERDITAALTAERAAREQAERERDELRERGDLIAIRCHKHYATPVQNRNEYSGGECGGCIAAERDTLRRERDVLLAEVRAGRELRDRFDSSRPDHGPSAIGQLVRAFTTARAATDAVMEVDRGE